MSILGSRKALLVVQEIQEANRRSAAAQLEAGESYSEPQIRQAIVHGREDIAGLAVIVGMVYGELRIIKWIGIVIAVLLAARMF